MCTLAIILAVIVILLHRRSHIRKWNIPRIFGTVANAKNTVKEISINDNPQYFQLKNLKHIQEDAMKNISSPLIDVLVKGACDEIHKMSLTIKQHIDASEQMETID